MAVESVRTGADGREPAAPALADLPAGVPDLSLSGTKADGEFRCADCGYGIVVRRELPACPMCGGAIWERSVRSRRSWTRER